MIGETRIAPADPAALYGLVMPFADTCRLTGNPKYARHMVTVIKRLLWFVGAVSPKDLTAAAIQRYLAALAIAGAAPKTIRNHASAISAFCDFLRRLNLLPINPCRDLTLPRMEERLPNWLRPEEIAELKIAAQNHGILAEVEIALATGVRLSELARMQWADVEVERRMLAVPRSKSHRPRIIPLSRIAVEALERQRTVSGIFAWVFPARRTWRGAWKYIDEARSTTNLAKAMRLAVVGISRFNQGRGVGRGWHLLRHTFASGLAQAGVSLYKIAAWLGHRDVRTTQIYAHLQAGFDNDIERGNLTERKSP
ncbi:MAG TPA: tyrosine-type recombinase/integrase [Phycisphaerae bacterium]|nr:tyrosine-type recombinase/integrase [Phycisphaerae bacterium]